MSADAVSFDYPVFLNLKSRLVVLVGAGTVGRRKLAGLLHCGAQVTLIDPCLAGHSSPAAGVKTVPRGFEAGDLAGAVLVFACTDQVEVNRAVLEEARRCGILCSCSEQSSQADFALPAVLRRGPLAVAVSTGGGSPALAGQLRDRLAEQLPDSWGLGVEIIAAVRRKGLTEEPLKKYNQRVLRNFWEEQLIPALEQGTAEAVDLLLQETFGKEFSLAQLQIQLPEGMPWVR